MWLKRGSQITHPSQSKLPAVPLVFIEPPQVALRIGHVSQMSLAQSHNSRDALPMCCRKFEQSHERSQDDGSFQECFSVKCSPLACRAQGQGVMAKKHEQASSLGSSGRNCQRSGCQCRLAALAEQEPYVYRISSSRSRRHATHSCQTACSIPVSQSISSLRTGMPVIGRWRPHPIGHKRPVNISA